MIAVEPMPLAERVEALRAAGEACPGLLEALDSVDPQGDPGHVLAFSRECAGAAEAFPAIRREGKAPVLGHLEPEELGEFEPIASVEIPPKPIYSLVDVDLGGESRNVTPEEALKDILTRGRSPLTIEEGIALMLQQPGAIEKNWGFSLAGSRRGDQRVPAFWVSEGRPKLGWCWDRNPHTWLGTASCAARV